MLNHQIFYAMKKLFLLLFALPFAFISCTDDDSTGNNESQTLAKTITYYPLQSNYTSKRIAYFNNNGQFIADTLFDSSGNVLSRSAVSFTANTKTTSYYQGDDTFSYANTNTFDSQGRITLIQSTQFENDITYTYNADGSITYSETDNGQQAEVVTFFTNPQGLITSMQFAGNIPAEEAYISFNNSTPSEYISVYNGNSEQVFTSFTFYDVVKPQNAQLSIIERNNRIIQQAQLNQVADTHDHYLKSYSNLWEYNSTFNANNYITYTMYTALAQPNDTSETFFYYN